MKEIILLYYYHTSNLFWPKSCHFKFKKLWKTDWPPHYGLTGHAIKNLKMPKKVRQGGQNWGKTTSKLELKTFFARNGKSFFQSKLHQIFWLSAPSDGSLYVWLHIASFILDPAFDYFAFVFCDFLISNSVKLSVIIGVTKKLFNLWSKFICLFTTGWRSGCALQYKWRMVHLQYLVIWCVHLLGFNIQ